LTRILQIIPFPTARPRDGGQIRAQQTGKALEAAGITVIRCPIYRAAWQPNAIYQPPVVNLDEATHTPRYPHIWQLYDMTNGEVLANDARCFAALKGFVDQTRPDVLMLEHPWLWPAVKKLSDRPPVIYNSYNLEAELKCRILRDAGITDTDSVAAEIGALERDLVMAAAGISATTEADAAVYRNWTSGSVVVAPNGAERRERAHLHDVLPDTFKYWWRYLLFVASAHPPNVAGFAELVLGGLGAMRSDERIVVAGSVCEPIREYLRNNAVTSLGSDRLLLLGQVSSFELDCLIENTTGMLLPITYGGGSNLKTAEALLAGRPVIATAKAFRGCEVFTDMAGIIIAETERAFSDAIRRVLSGEVPSPPQDARLASIVWDKTLQPIVDLVGEVVSQNRSTACCDAPPNSELPARPASAERNSGQRLFRSPNRGHATNPSNDDLLALVPPWSGRVPRGYVPTFTGAMVAVQFWAHWLSPERIAEQGRSTLNT
jgi:glycosyltransferase involved in cell wall biosynthesis